MFLLIDASVKVTARMDGDGTALLAIRLGGDVIGEIASEFEQWLRSRTNKEKRPFHAETVVGLRESGPRAQRRRWRGLGTPAPGPAGDDSGG
jgi:hypothetical protein